MTAAGSIRIGTRASLLAMSQSRQVADALAAAHEGLSVELVQMVTRGDTTHGPLTEVGGKGLFTAELEAALRSGEVDLAVHSAKDLPADMDMDLVMAAVPQRADARDALISPGGGSVAELPAGAVVGTGSPRRAVQLLALRPDLTIAPIRGNIDTRMRKALAGRGEAGRLDAVVLAMAGLCRSGLLDPNRRNICPLEIENFIPAAGQGSLVVQAATGNSRARLVAASLDDEPSRQALEAERMILRALGAQCRSCIAVHISRHGEGWRALAMAAREDGSGAVRATAVADAAGLAGNIILDSLRRQGAEELLRLDE